MSRAKTKARPDASSSNPKDSLGALKVDLGAIPKVATIYQALAHMDGGGKYGIKNWRNKAVLISVYLSAIQRHTAQLEAGEDIDKKSGVPHSGHIMACCAIIEDARAAGCLIDDRREKDHAADVLAALTSDAYDASTLKLTRTPARTLDEVRGGRAPFSGFLAELKQLQEENRARVKALAA